MKKRSIIDEKKGISNVITVILLIGLSVVAVGVIWVVINNLLQGNIEGIGQGADCLDVRLDIESVTCDSTAGICDVRVSRQAGGETIDGVKLIFENSTTSRTVDAGPVNPLESNTFSVDPIVEVPTGVSVAAYFVSEAGSENICTPSSSQDI